MKRLHKRAAQALLRTLERHAGRELTLAERFEGIVFFSEALKLSGASLHVFRLAITNGEIDYTIAGGRVAMLERDVVRWRKMRWAGAMDGRRPHVKKHLMEQIHAADLDACPWLSERARDMMRRRFGLGEHKIHTLDQIGQLYGLSRERVRQILKGACDRMLLEDEKPA